MLIKIRRIDNKHGDVRKHIIIIPKKNVKKACWRNKLRRQIRAILREKRDIVKNPICIKYLDKNMKPNFLVLRQTLLLNYGGL